MPSRIATTPLLTLLQVSNQLNVSVRTVRRLVEAGQIPFVRIGKSVRISAAHLQGYILSHTEIIAK
jgi:excisionase family DNA binding protein